MNLLGSSYDNTGALGASTWRHVAFIEQSAAPGDFRWLMESDVCKHCTHAACLDVCPTGSLFRTAFGAVVVREDICNGCGDCVPACPYGVSGRRPGDGRAFPCTLCSDRVRGGRPPAAARARPTGALRWQIGAAACSVAWQDITDVRVFEIRSTRFLAIDARPGSVRMPRGQRLLARANRAVARADVSISLEAFPVEPDRLAEAIAACAHDAGRRRQIGSEPSLAWLTDPATRAQEDAERAVAARRLRRLVTAGGRTSHGRRAG